MNARSLMYLVDTMQSPLWIDGSVVIKGDQVFCPMCEEWHKNNSLCQMPMEGL